MFGYGEEEEEKKKVEEGAPRQHPRQETRVVYGTSVYVERI